MSTSPTLVALLCATAAAMLLIACADGGEQEARTVTVEAPPDAPQPRQTSPEPGQPDEGPALEPLPPGVVGADGT